jgi:hypothetical protein
MIMRVFELIVRTHEAESEVKSEYLTFAEEYANADTRELVIKQNGMFTDGRKPKTGVHSRAPVVTALQNFAVAMELPRLHQLRVAHDNSTSQAPRALPSSRKPAKLAVHSPLKFLLSLF